MVQKKTVDRPCYFCKQNINAINYKDTNTLKRYLSSFGKIVPRKRSGVCAWHQRKLANAIKRARHMALLPYLVR
ncbi:30S ribosomal protein S18 [Candidatus Uhrbacteria bacterium RIFCSPHIGHO2_12_FULL_60_25]|uniref:Small ribosomal subunit protein bS18 n=1 Tax=Candidatus Uhrbacteria bacterium RIFCSPHIGHO2_12_FULL_60_25 TaxID=1802399 RepID=A0A1F7UJ28_9BACT|nr:MAG: 30S ribosomal protein S18 [Candidatus Uhrbacteria bacterium RIFCSPHIGHO2_02_FULL_60_44]OGL78280.1 MAG: 30S ribosomal protein S18 [Candidatus Uhrbacteria bacterium RIFCSPHIGHO2_12_FULL_60_25]